MQPPSNPFTPPAAAQDAPPAFYGKSGEGDASEAIIDIMNGTRPWVMLIGVLLMLSAGMMCLGAVGIAVAGSLSETGLPWWIGILYLAMGVLYIYPGIALAKYAGAIKRLVQSRAVTDLEDALVRQRSFWRFVGISAAVLMVVYGLAIVSAMVAGALGALG